MGSIALYSQYFNNLALSDENLDRLHKIEIEMLRDLDRLCKKYNIKYMLSGGSVLGAVRHKGFIPWDDDIDVMMYRDDYNKLDDAFKEMYGDKYIIKSNDNDKKFVGKMKKIYLRGTEFVEIEKENYPEETCIFIDVFAIDKMPNSKIARKIRGAIHDFAFLATGAIYCYKYPSKTIMDMAAKDKEVKKFYNKKRIIGAILSVFFGFRFYMWLEKKTSRYSNNHSKYEGIPTGIRYNREIFPRDTFRETILWDFEGEQFPIPKNYDAYLTNLYGDYMWIPPVEKREIHAVSKLNFGKYDENERD